MPTAIPIGQAIADAVAVGIDLCGLGVICDDPNEYAVPGNIADTEISQDYGEAASEARQCGNEPPDKCKWLEEKNAVIGLIKLSAPRKHGVAGVAVGVDNLYWYL